MKSYFTFLGRNKLYTAIQFFGLAIALGVVILLTSYADTEFNIGNNQSYSHQLYAVGYGDGIGMTTGTAPELFPSIPEIKEWTRLIHIEAADFMVDNQYYQVNGIAADPNFFQMLNYTLIGCDRNKALIGTDEVILSEPFAHKVFGNENPIGRTVMYLNQTPLRVIGVLPAFSSTELLKPIDILIPFKLAEKDYAWMDSYGSTQILITLEEGVTPDVVTRKLLDKYKGYWEYWKEDNSTNRLFWGSSVTRMDEIYFSPLNQYGPFRKGTRKQVQILFSLAFVLLLSAIFNYINLTVSQTSKRAHEMATRRLMGDSAGQIVLRYLAESAIFTTGCFIGGCLVAVITKPYFEYLLSTRIALVSSPAMVAYSLLLWVGIAGISGLLPAIITYKYSPIDIVKGNFRMHNKQLFIRQLKTNNMGSRTIDEGAIDEKSGMNFSEYVAVLSGNTDLLDKARLEKKIATLESERQAFVRGKSSSRYKLEQITEKIEKNNDLIRRIGKDLEHFKARVEFNEDGSYRNPVKLNGLETSDPKLIGKQLNRIAETARTLDRLEPIGSLYGFELLVQSETTGKDGLDLVQNRFYVRGEGDYLYQYNYGNIASDPRLAAMNFIHALATIEPTLEKFRKKNEELEKDIPVLREVVESSWRKEPELTALKTDLTEIDRRIQQSLKPIEESEGKEAEEDNDVCRERHDTAEELPKEDNTAARIPSRLRQIADASGGRIVIAGVGSPPENGPAKKGIKM